MKRRVLLGSTIAVALSPDNVRAQQKAMPVIGYLSFASAADVASFHESFLAGLRDLGYVDGRTIHIESRYADGNNDRMPALAATLVALKPNLIVTYATGVMAVRQATATIPIVMQTGPDPVSIGLAVSLAHPGGNVTGSTFFYAELMAKRLELLKELNPSMAQVGVVLLQGNGAVNGAVLEAMGVTGRALGVKVQPFEVAGPAEFEGASSAWANGKIQGIVVTDHSKFMTDANVAVLAALAARNRLPLIGAGAVSKGGGLMSYGVDFSEQFRRSAFFVDRILKGARPGDLPIEQPTRFQFVINLRTAKALGLTIPPSMLARADEVIE